MNYSSVKPFFIACIFIMSCFTASSFAEPAGKMKLAVLDFISETGTDKKDLMTLSETLRGELTKFGLFEVMPGRQVDKMLAGAGFNTADLTSDEDNKARLKLGKLLNAKLAVTGVVNSAFKNISMNIHLLDLETGDILMAETPPCGEDAVFKEVHEIAMDLADKFSNIGPAGNDGQPKPGAVRIVPNNLIAAGNFPDGSYTGSETPGNWSFAQDRPAKGYINISSGICTVVTEKTSGNPWNVQLYYFPVKMKFGAIYTLTFDVKSDGERKLFVTIVRNGGDFKAYFTRKHFDSTTEWQTITYDFKSMGTDDNSKFEFDCANDKPTLYLRNVSLVESRGED